MSPSELEESPGDSERPSAVEVPREQLPAQLKAPVRRSLFTALTFLGAALVFVALIRWTSLSELSSFERVQQIVVSLRDSPYSLVYVSLLFVAATLVFCPIMLLIGATVLVFEDGRGFAHAMLGSLAAASASYWVGRMVGPPILKSWTNPRLLSLRGQLQRHGFRASAIARVLPVGNFTIINLIAGAVPVRFAAFFAGNVLGLLPGVLSLTLLASQLEELVRSPNARNVGELVVCMFGVGLSLYVISKIVGKWQARRSARRAANGSAA